MDTLQAEIDKFSIAEKDYKQEITKQSNTIFSLTAFLAFVVLIVFGFAYKSGTWVDNILVIVIRLTITGFIVMLGFFLAFIATMGPPIAPHIWNGGLQWKLRPHRR